MPGESSSSDKWLLALLLIVIAALVGTCSWKLGGPSATVGLLGIGYFASRDGAGQGSVWVVSIYSLALLGWVLGAEAGRVLGVFITSWCRSCRECPRPKGRTRYRTAFSCGHTILAGARPTRPADSSRTW